MNAIYTRVLAFCVCAFIAYPALAQVSILENFSAGSVNTTKFNSSEASINLDTTNENVELISRGFGFTENVRRTRLNLVNETSSTIQADLVINSVVLGNVDTQLAFISVAGFFYNAVSATPSSIEGDVFARVGFGDLGSGLQAFYVISQNTNSEGGFEVTQFGIIDAGPLSLDTAYTASITYDGVNNFVFVFNGVNANVAGPTEVGSPFNAQRRVDTGINFGEINGTSDRNDAQNDDGSIASIVGRIDNVTDENGLVDDFNDAELNTSIWQSREFSRTVESGKIKLISDSFDGARMRTSLPVTNQVINFLGAKTTLSSGSTQVDAGTRSRARVGGFWYNDTFDSSATGNEWEGNVWAHIEVRQNGTDQSTECRVFAERFNDATGATQRTTLVSQTLNDTCLLDTEYDLSIEKTDNSLVFRKDGAAVHTMSIATPSHPAKGQRLKVVRADTRGGIGSTHALFDDISTDYSAPSLSLNAQNGNDEDVAYPQQAIVNEGELVTLTAAVTNPASISAYIWEQTAGPDVTIASPRSDFANKLVGGNNQSLSFTVPTGADTQTLQFKVTIVDDNGVESAQAFQMSVDNSSASTLAAATNPTTSTGGGSSGGGAINPLIILLLLTSYLFRIYSSRII